MKLFIGDRRISRRRFIAKILSFSTITLLQLIHPIKIFASLVKSKMPETVQNFSILSTSPRKLPLSAPKASDVII